MYLGIGPERGLRIPDREAFGYACNRCRYGEEEEQEGFWKLAKECDDFQEFVQVFTEWYYSGNWFYDPYDNKETNWIIRFSDGNLRAFFGTYMSAVLSAREEAKGKGLGFVIC